MSKLFAVRQAGDKKPWYILADTIIEVLDWCDVTFRKGRDDVESIEVASWMGIRDVRKNPEVDS
jgi:hypothetical protein